MPRDFLAGGTGSWDSAKIFSASVIGAVLEEAAMASEGESVTRKFNIQSAMMLLVRDARIVTNEGEFLIVNTDPLMTASKQARHVTQEVYNHVDSGLAHGSCTTVNSRINVVVTIPR